MGIFPSILASPFRRFYLFLSIVHTIFSEFPPSLGFFASLAGQIPLLTLFSVGLPSEKNYWICVPSFPAVRCSLAFFLALRLILF